MKSLFKGLIVLSMVWGGMAFAQNLSDADIGEIMKVVNDAEIDAAKAAKSRADHKEVQDFAKHMIDEHEKNIKEGKDVFKEANIKPRSNDTAKNMKEDAKRKLDDLKKQKKGAEFDRAYIGTQVSMHQQVLNELNQVYIPATRDPRVKAYLEKTRDHVQQHLSKAQELQSKLVQ
ncbi:MAG: DUF4142 domain-containing protein [Bdellovibrio sp.]